MNCDYNEYRKEYIKQYNKNGTGKSIRTTVYANRELWQRFKVWCAENETSASKAMDKLLSSFLGE